MNINDLERLTYLRKEIIVLEDSIKAIKKGYPDKPIILTNTNRYSFHNENITAKISPEINQQIINLIIFGLEEKLNTLAEKMNKLGVNYERFIK